MHTDRVAAPCDKKHLLQVELVENTTNIKDESAYKLQRNFINAFFSTRKKYIESNNNCRDVADGNTFKQILPSTLTV